MRQATSILLCTVLLLHWASECRRCFQVTYQLEERYEMDKQESAIAEKLANTLRRRFLVKVVRRPETELRGNHYPGFLFSEASEEDTLRFVLLEKSRNISTQPGRHFSEKQPYPTRLPGETSLSEIFVKYLMALSAKPAHNSPAWSALPSTVPLHYSSRRPPVPTPPPRAGAPA